MVHPEFDNNFGSHYSATLSHTSYIFKTRVKLRATLCGDLWWRPLMETSRIAGICFQLFCLLHYSSKGVNAIHLGPSLIGRKINFEECLYLRMLKTDFIFLQDKEM